MTQEGSADPRTLETLVRALRVLDDRGRSVDLVAPSFFFRMLEVEGGAPILDSCAACGESESDLVAFDLAQGGTLCRSCRRGRPLSAEALTLMRRILGGDLTSVLAGPPPPGAAEVINLATEAMESHLERRLRSVRSSTSL